MNRSEHYNLYLVEGSDPFNPLVTDVPNYEVIDSALYSVEQAAITTATELVSGTVHALTRNGTGNVFKFVATGNAKSGDTYTVDGVQVSALLPSGETLGDGAYVINATVICALNGTVLTFYLGSGSVTEAEDSKKLGGQLPEYYGTASAVSAANAAAGAAQSIALAAQEIATQAKEEAESVLDLELAELSYTLTNGQIIPFSRPTFVTATVTRTSGNNQLRIGIRTGESSDTIPVVRLNPAQSNAGTLSISFMVPAGAEVVVENNGNNWTATGLKVVYLK